MKNINTLLLTMTEYYQNDPQRIQHFMKVYTYARFISEQECVDTDQLYTICVAAIVHDIGIKEAEKKYNASNGKLQEKEGPPLAEKMLTSLHYDREIIERVCYLVGHHHTYDDIVGLDYQILVEADFLVNMYEDHFSQEAITHAYHSIFKTATGKQLCQVTFG